MKKNDLNKKENFKKWLFRTPEQRYIDKITHKIMKLKIKYFLDSKIEKQIIYEVKIIILITTKMKILQIINNINK